ncbi:adenosylcobinamide-GDP ribazoletransferase [Lichenibacterium minor]|uniref:Adenosylcobinamide-GDP ribazoletransferase n=1 Tax=Lichenibacterium minor TaxID=2316528 RepID=A0A4Q2U703_9HYPH|nr:adenosylcobinamide-GDP ribazoletransferase [Lichenibacterium minor]RYC31668.1 adenosylcobinamide-GDP ribazoletransferase [Lichenibacterium minor]
MPAPPPPAALLAEAVTCLRFYTRLPVPALACEASHTPDPFARCLRWAPLAGLVVGAFGAAALAGAAALGLPSAVAATAAVSSTVLVTGGLHEDGLGDCADGFGGGATRCRKLEIMRDSRLGSYGVLAIGLSLALRIGALAALADRGGPVLAGAALAAAAAASRGLGLMPMARLPPARADGLGHGAGRLPGAAFPIACAGALALGFALPILAGAPPSRAALALGLAASAAWGTTLVAERQIGGVTGDVAGACQQVCDIALLVGLLIVPRAG